MLLWSHGSLISPTHNQLKPLPWRQLLVNKVPLEQRSLTFIASVALEHKFSYVFMTLPSKTHTLEATLSTQGTFGTTLLHVYRKCCSGAMVLLFFMTSLARTLIFDTTFSKQGALGATLLHFYSKRCSGWSNGFLLLHDTTG